MLKLGQPAPNTIEIHENDASNFKSRIATDLQIVDEMREYTKSASHVTSGNTMQKKSSLKKS